MVRRSPREIYAGLEQLQADHSKETYYRVRSGRPEAPIDAAIRFIYLNRTCWNGLYRVNRQNEFNVPMGTKTAVLMPDDDFALVAAKLRRVTLAVADFETIIDEAASGDLVFVDPPYTVKHNMNGFLKYNQDIFTWQDQVRLRDCLARAKRRGCHIVMSNADHESIRDLYRGFAPTESVARFSIIAGSSKARSETTELLMVHHG